MFLAKDFDQRRQADKKSFYCPNGHPQAYIESTSERLKKRVTKKP